jgi:hypothetical protein
MSHHNEAYEAELPPVVVASYAAYPNDPAVEVESAFLDHAALDERSLY